MFSVSFHAMLCCFTLHSSPLSAVGNGSPPEFLSKLPIKGSLGFLNQCFGKQNPKSHPLQLPFLFWRILCSFRSSLPLSPQHSLSYLTLLLRRTPQVAKDQIKSNQILLQSSFLSPLWSQVSLISQFLCLSFPS